MDIARTNPKVALLVATALVVAACGSSGDSSESTGSTSPATTQAPPASSAATPTTDTARPTTTAPPTTKATPPTNASDDALVAEIQAILDASLQPGAITWNRNGVELPPTGVSVGVRIPGREDILLSSGTTLDGQPFDPAAPFLTTTLGWAALIDVALTLVDAGVLDPNATVDRWMPTAPNASLVTVQMLIDGTSGWGNSNDTLGDAATIDPSRVWTPAEALPTIDGIPPAAEPGTFSVDAGQAGVFALGHIIELITGTPLAELVVEHVSAPTGLDDTFISDGTDLPAAIQHGRFAVEGAELRSTEPPASLVAYLTYMPPEGLVSTIPDLLDLLGTWSDGTWREGGVPPATDQFPADRYNEGSNGYVGLGVPYTGYCPCTPTAEGNLPETIGRRPFRAGTSLNALHYVADDVSIVLHFNSSDSADVTQTKAVADKIHAAVEAGR